MTKSDLDAWKALAARELKGRTPEDLVWKTIEGIDIKPLYTEADVEGLDHLGTVPGAEPFVRGRIVDAGTNDAKPERLSRSAEARCSVQPDADGGSRAGAVEMSAADVFLRNPAGHEPDNCRLLHLNEPCVLLG